RAVVDEERGDMGDALHFWLGAPADFAGVFIERECGGFAFLTAVENDQVLVDDGRIAVAVFTGKLERLNAPAKLAVEIVATKIRTVAGLEGSNNVFAIGGDGGRGGAVLAVH